jgi:hypothetical protein
MTAKTYLIKGTAGKKYACSVPQNVHQINGTTYAMDKLTMAQAETIMLVNPTFLIKHTEQADAEKKAQTSTQNKK